MVTTNAALDYAFKILTDKAKDPNLSDDNLRDNLAYFLQISDYQRTPYRMQFGGFFRARAGWFDSIEKACHPDGFGNIERLSVAPEHLTRLCRCNLEKQPVFYCSSENAIPIFEVRPQIGQYIALASFIPKNGSELELTLPIIGVKQIKEGIEKHDPRDHMVRMLQDDMHFKSVHSLSLEIDSRLADLFVTPVNDDNKHIYRLTTAFYNGLLKYAHAGDERVNALLYPSVEGKLSGYNIAMEKEVAKDNLRLGPTTIFKVENILPKVTFLRPLKQLKYIKEDGDIEWEEAIHSNRLWAVETTAPVYHGLNFKRITRYAQSSIQRHPYDSLGF